MKHVKDIAEHAAMQSFLNCYLRETGNGRWVTTNGEKYLHVPLVSQKMDLYVKASYQSPTGRHQFDYPAFYQSREEAPAVEADYVTMTVLLVKELSLQHGTKAVPDELVLRVIQSCQNMERYLAARYDDREELYGFEMDFITAEQALLFGHLFHPTPKSRQGIPDTKQAVFSPEQKGAFPLHYFAAHHSLVLEGSGLKQSATEIIKAELGQEVLEQDGIRQYAKNEDYSLIPLHPLQAEWMLDQHSVQKYIKCGLLHNLGLLGECYQATSSLRTVYHPDKSFMIKLSIPVKVTNSLRVNKRAELESGVEAKKVLDMFEEEMSKQFPGFAFIHDPAYITLKLDEQDESGFEVILRHNPFQGSAAENATVLAALIQDPLPGQKSRLAVIILQLAQQEGRTPSEVSLEWFRRYLEISLKPMVWLYLKWGIGLEAHQQNSIVKLQDGYPSQFYYRDNQGYYYCQSMKELLSRNFPNLGEMSKNVTEDSLVDERLRYYLIFNHMFGLINGFGSAGLIDEQQLLDEMRSVLQEFLPLNREPSQFLHSLLTSEKLACKANLLTRFHDVDELESEESNSAIFVKIDNPLAKARERQIELEAVNQLALR
ncbi:IucA/IucC family protein [Brevibacillus halotolerans]|uniref:IucA/IucC family protein n=1 Tax=Brevibacillus halotolerans TaxID=1507437 RepID=UPI0015EF930E|nr:IucA/IucC family protein [Brevibacillus halotolerans]MBA4531564.1 IucA/IucC family siderophore biosynthesis protein [Brevibacillus halotolerans]